jgi:hypothetical protein
MKRMNGNTLERIQARRYQLQVALPGRRLRAKAIDNSYRLLDLSVYGRHCDDKIRWRRLEPCAMQR